MQQLSIRSKIILTLLLTGLASLATGGIIGYQSGAKALSESVERQLIAQREGKKRQVASYIRNQLRLTETVGDAPQTIEAAKAFIDEYLDAVRPVALPIKDIGPADNVSMVLLERRSTVGLTPASGGHCLDVGRTDALYR